MSQIGTRWRSVGQQREVFVFNLVTRETLEEQILRLLDEKISMFELVVGEVGAILGGLEEDREFADLMLDAWLPRPKRAATRRSTPSVGACKRRTSTTREPRSWTNHCSAKTSRPREASRMSELRDFVAELMESKGAVVEALDPDGLEVLAPAPLQKAMGWPELARLGFGNERTQGAIGIGLEGDWLERFGAQLGDKGRWSQREGRPAAAVPAPSDPERLLGRAVLSPAWAPFPAAWARDVTANAASGRT
jgi:hypothetical protein